MSIHELEALDQSGWNRKTARHLLNRAGFGVPLERVDQLEKLKLHQAVDELVKSEQADESFKEPEGLVPPRSYKELKESYQQMDADERRQMTKMNRRQERQAIDGLKSWWVDRILHTERPLQEKMTIFWHGHFATSAQKVKSSTFNYNLNRVFREYGLGNFKTLVTQVSQSPAMMIYLDNRKNIKGRPNENFARELMELFTVGIGNYSEEDIKESARAFTGWTSDAEGRFVFNRRKHDSGKKTFLGHTGQFDGYDIIRILCERPVMAEFMSKKLWEFFVYENPDEKLVKQLAIQLRQSDYEIKPFLRKIFLSREFYSGRAMHQQIKSPAQLLVNLVDQLQLDSKKVPQRLFQYAMRAMGQDLFYPPNVKGWPGNRAWINSNTLLTRYNMGAFVLYGRGPFGSGRGRSMAPAGRNKGLSAPFDANTFFERYENKTAGQTIDLLADHFVGRSLDKEQRKVLLEVIHPDASESLRIPKSQKSTARLLGVVHLILSTAEYQLC